ncbi:hypothetical protein IT415_03865 [bacterium]|nr:hypothetical protein [bacterium]
MPRRVGNISGKKRKNSHKQRAHGSGAKSHQYKAKKSSRPPRARPAS